MSKKVRKCCICGKAFVPGDWGNNPEPVKSYSEGTCCDKCNRDVVIPARLVEIKNDRSLFTSKKSTSKV